MKCEYGILVEVKGENRSTLRRTYPTATSTTINP